MRDRVRWLVAFLARRLSPGGALGLSLTLGLLAITAGGWAFAELLEDVVDREELSAQDSPVSAWLLAHRVGWLTTAMQAATTLGSIWVTLPVVVAGAALARRGRRRVALGMVLAVLIGTSISVNAIKLLIGRPRPDLTTMLTAAGGFAFPSGHSAQAAAAYGILAWLVTARAPRRAHRVLVWVGTGYVVATVGFSRVYLGAHWLTDVLGGWSLGATWLMTVVTVVTTSQRVRATRRRPVAGEADPGPSDRRPWRGRG